MIIETKLRVRYKETDQMGVVHHSNYYTWFEVGRTEYIRQAGLPYRAMEDKGIMLPVLETHCRYIHGARYDDLLTIRTWISSFKGVRLSLGYQVIRDEDGVVLAEGSTIHCFTDSAMRPVNIKKSIPYIYEIFYKCIEQ